MGLYGLVPQGSVVLFRHSGGIPGRITESGTTAGPFGVKTWECWEIILGEGLKNTHKMK